MPAQKGSALILTLWSVLFIALLISTAGSRLWMEVLIASRAREQVQARKICLAAIHWMETGNAGRVCNFPEGQAEFKSIEREEGKINLNRAPLKIIAAIPGMTAEAAVAIQDWRDADSLATVDGVENSYYQSLPNSYDCANAPLRSLQELLMLRGISDKLFQDIRSEITVYGDGKLDINWARPSALCAIGFDRGLIEKIHGYRAGKDGSPGTADDRLFDDPQKIVSVLSQWAGLRAEEAQQIATAVSSSFFGIQSEHVRVKLTVQTVGGFQKEYETVLKINRSPRPWSIEECLSL